MLQKAKLKHIWQEQGAHVVKSSQKNFITYLKESCTSTIKI